MSVRTGRGGTPSPGAGALFVVIGRGARLRQPRLPTISDSGDYGQSPRPSTPGEGAPPRPSPTLAGPSGAVGKHRENRGQVIYKKPGTGFLFAALIGALVSRLWDEISNLSPFYGPQPPLFADLFGRGGGNPRKLRCGFSAWSADLQHGVRVYGMSCGGGETKRGILGRGRRVVKACNDGHFRPHTPIRTPR